MLHVVYFSHWTCYICIFELLYSYCIVYLVVELCLLLLFNKGLYNVFLLVE